MSIRVANAEVGWSGSRPQILFNRVCSAIRKFNLDRLATSATTPASSTTIKIRFTTLVITEPFAVFNWSPHPPTPSPHKFGLSLTPMGHWLVRIFGERGSVWVAVWFAICGRVAIALDPDFSAWDCNGSKPNGIELTESGSAGIDLLPNHLFTEPSICRARHLIVRDHTNLSKSGVHGRKTKKARRVFT